MENDKIRTSAGAKIYSIVHFQFSILNYSVGFFKCHSVACS